MLEPIKNVVNAKNLCRVPQNDEIRKMGRAGRRVARSRSRAVAGSNRASRPFCPEVAAESHPAFEGFILKG